MVLNKTRKELPPTKIFIGVSLKENFSSKVSSLITTSLSGYFSRCKNFFLFDSNPVFRSKDLRILVAKLFKHSFKHLICQKNRYSFLLKHKNLLYIFLTGCLLFVLGQACNPTRDRWINRKWHTLTGHYNIYFNGEQKLLAAVEQLEKGHKNDFNKVLDVFPYGDESAAKGVSNLLDEALKKFGGTIMLHKVGTYTDNAYFSAAKCHFFKRDYYAGMEALQYVIAKYPEYKDIATNWIAKCYVGLEKVQEAEAVSSLLVAGNKNIRKEDLTEIFCTAADINIRLEKYKSAFENLKKVVAEGKLNKNQKIRIFYIMGQLSVLRESNSEAMYYFNKVIKLTPSYDFEFNANIQLTKLYNPADKKAVNKVRRGLKRMANDDKNLDYLDQIYYELGRLELGQKNYTAAIGHFRQSVAKSTRNPSQKTKSYLELSKLYFELKDYKNAQAYYDTISQVIDKNDKQFELIKNTRAVLNDLINNLVVYETEDSLQRLGLLSKDALERRIDEWIAAEKKKKELEAKDAKKRKAIEASMAANNAGGQTKLNNFSLDNTNASWYFYNPGLVASGNSEFFSGRKWGNRANEDFWRITAKEKPKTDDSGTEKTDSVSNPLPDEGLPVADKPRELKSPKDELPKFTGIADKDRWIKNVPFTETAKRQSNARVMEALHNMGKIYYEKLKNPAEAVKHLEELERRFPKNEYEPEVFYLLFKMYSDLQKKEKAQFYKDELLKTYPRSNYALLAQGKPIETAESDANTEVVKQYEKMYESYTQGNFAEAKKLKWEADKKYPGNNLRPKFEYLYALAVGQTDSLGAFKQSLNYVVTEFKGTDVAARAQQTLEILNRSMQKAAIVGGDSSLNDLKIDLETEVPHYYIFAIKNDKADFSGMSEKLIAYNEQYASLDNLRTNALMSNEGYQMLVVRKFDNYKKALAYYEGIKANDVANKRLAVKDPYIDFVISEANFKVVLKDKKLEKYHSFFLKKLNKEAK